MEDIKIRCKDCGSEFVFSAKDQLFYEQKGFSRPIRCKSCRELKKKGYSTPNSKDDYFKKLYKKFKRNTVKF